MNNPNKPLSAQDIECPHCEGQGIWYGLAPHIHDMEKTGSIIGSTKLLPKKLWPVNFMPDPEAEGCGTWHCANCSLPPRT